MLYDRRGDIRISTQQCTHLILFAAVSPTSLSFWMPLQTTPKRAIASMSELMWTAAGEGITTARFIRMLVVEIHRGKVHWKYEINIH
jgi:hypothetical protein